jgi:cytochrome c553
MPHIAVVEPEQRDISVMMFVQIKCAAHSKTLLHSGLVALALLQMHASHCYAQPGNSQVPGSPFVSPPAWAYPVNPPNMPQPRDSHALVHVAHSNLGFLPSQLRDLYSAPDWYPKDHPAMPAIVSHGRKPEVFACAYCHLPDGAGRPENASLAGLPADYIIQQLQDYASGARRTSVAERAPPRLMSSLARSASDTEIRAAAEYFSQLKPQHRIKVVPARTVPQTYVAGWFLAIKPDAPREPLGQRIIEVPADLEQFEHRDARATFIAYVPVGSVKAGAALIKTGGSGKTVACTTCHGAKLRGLGNVPGIAGRSPSYIVRQLFDIQSGARNGIAVAPMTPVVKNLAVDDMVAIAASLATLH